MNKPIVGLTTYPASATHGWHTPALYVDAVLRAGGVPMMLSGQCPDCAERWLDVVDGVVLIGGGDINPAEFGSAGHETIYNLSAERDAMELALMRALLTHPKPVLAICRGMQILNTVLGGTLHVHLPDVVGESVLHRAPPRDPIQHSIQVAADSELAKVIGQQVHTASWHHQAIDQLGQGLKAVAWAPDGVIEAVELEGRQDLLAVQWHPEITAAEDDGQQHMFDWLIKQANQ
ncbi:MAG: gamma-glutamyl-gamma-aminobutyrate hydrolase family protein [Vitreoscilla sp.]|jgi:putative glutamine amidotransferase|nr:gamma-glutamyl-gamma-aminobutyrate hydrolase family protein [Vitreoscilla sp.]MBP9539638.1 gamma-glutamyl-gamma-aminobutyrate hydrolase family protein [Vitreoscilla sp.]